MFNRVGNAPRAQSARNVRGGAQRSPRLAGEQWILAFCSEHLRRKSWNIEHRTRNDEGPRKEELCWTPNFVIRYSLFGVRHSTKLQRTSRLLGASLPPGAATTAGRKNVGRNKPAQFRHRGSAFAIGLPELRKLVPAYGLNQQFPRVWHRGECRSADERREAHDNSRSSSC